MPTMSPPYASRTRSRTHASDPDDDLISELHAPPPLDVCHEALEFWTRRHAGLPRRRRRARRDAAEMIARWEQRVRDAELAEQAGSVWHRLLEAFGFTWPTRSVRQATGRRVLLVLGGGIVALGGILMATAVVGLLVAYEVLSHLG